VLAEYIILYAAGLLRFTSQIEKSPIFPAKKKPLQKQRLFLTISNSTNELMTNGM
jgi:hypothetical protein